MAFKKVYLCSKIEFMNQIAGITTKKNTLGQITHVTIDITKYKELLPVFNEMDLLLETDFQRECSDAITVDDFRKRMHKKLKESWQSRCG